jgi:hypothetical protein
LRATDCAVLRANRRNASASGASTGAFELLGGDRVAADDHVDRHLQRNDARQSLRAAGTGHQPELDFRQGDLGTGHGHAVVAP